jgi:hypothetical protein
VPYLASVFFDAGAQHTPPRQFSCDRGHQLSLYRPTGPMSTRAPTNRTARVITYIHTDKQVHMSDHAHGTHTHARAQREGPVTCLSRYKLPNVLEQLVHLGQNVLWPHHTRQRRRSQQEPRCTYRHREAHIHQCASAWRYPTRARPYSCSGPHGRRGSHGAYASAS